MGLDINAVRFLIAAKEKGVRFDEVLMIARQDLNVFPPKMVEILRQHGLPTGEFMGVKNAEGRVESASSPRPSPPSNGGEGDTLHAEPVFRALGAKRVAAMDVSDFEGAEFVHDLNEPIPPELKERFDVVYDGGTLEHVFNFPLALRNCMEMVKVGGHLFTHTIANNYCGHGFYQFSPELFYTALSEENGFEIEWMVAHRVGPYGRWFEVVDPRKVRSRVEVLTWYPLQLLVRARRTAVVPIFKRPPQQSDYTVRWDDPNQPGGKAAPFQASRPRMARVFPNVARLLHVAKMGVALYRNQTLLNRKYFKPVKKP